MESRRNNGVDLLRMTATFFIIIHHLLGHGGLLKALPVNTPAYHAAWILEIAVYCAVNCYAMISG